MGGGTATPFPELIRDRSRQIDLTVKIDPGRAPTPIGTENGTGGSRLPRGSSRIPIAQSRDRTIQPGKLREIPKGPRKQSSPEGCRRGIAPFRVGSLRDSILLKRDRSEGAYSQGRLDGR